MKVSYFPGCTLRTKAKELDAYARECGALLGVELCEIPDWQCCGGVFSSAKDEIASKLPSVRAFQASSAALAICAARNSNVSSGCATPCAQSSPGTTQVLTR